MRTSFAVVAAIAAAGVVAGSAGCTSPSDPVPEAPASTLLPGLGAADVRLGETYGAVKAKLGVKVIYDLSATPFFLRGSGYTKLTADGKRISEGILFPWVVSDFSLIDAIESGIVYPAPSLLGCGGCPFREPCRVWPG